MHLTLISKGSSEISCECVHDNNSFLFDNCQHILTNEYYISTGNFFNALNSFLGESASVLVFLKSVEK